MRQKTCPISVVIPTYKRPEMLVSTISLILQCDPLPAEILVHVDGNDVESEVAVRDNFKQVTTLKSPTNIGPGGGRNLLVQRAQYEIVASFDDDSYPLDQDYFQRLTEVFQLYPEASVVASAVYIQQQPITEASQKATWVASFEGCGCAYRRSHFLKTDGYLQLPLAYAAEELDLAMQLYAQERKILCTQWLRVYHDTAYEHHKNPKYNAANITNIALLAYVRYPMSLWGRASLQVLNRVFYSLRMHRHAGILTGLVSIPGRLWSFRSYRKPIPHKVMSDYLALRRQPCSVPWSGQRP
jgi:GT2 family glycosyltransferase